MNSQLSHGSLFSGIGGFDLAAYWMGWNNVFQVEKDPWCTKILGKNFPNTKRFSDIREFTGDEYTNKIDVISGGFPCQPFSVAGNRKGDRDDRYLWEEMLRVIATIKPKFVVAENVTGIISLVLDKVLSDLENQDYSTETFIIPACGKNAWHRRDRVWIIAYSNSSKYSRDSRKKARESNTQRVQEYHKMEFTEQSDNLRVSSVFSDTASFRKLKGEQISKSKFFNKNGCERESTSNANYSNCEKQWESIADETKHFAPRCNSWWQTEPGVGRVVNGLPNRVDRLKGLGNAIVPQIAYEFFYSIEELINYNKSNTNN